MNKDRKILLIILYFSILLSLSFLNIFILNEKRTEVLTNIELLEKQYVKRGNRSDNSPLGDLEKLRDLISTESSRYFSIEDSDPYELGLKIISMLESQHLEIGEYRTLEIDDSYLLEFSIKGSSYGFFRFLEILYHEDNNYKIPQLALKNEKEGISSTFRIGYAFYE